MTHQPPCESAHRRRARGARGLAAVGALAGGLLVTVGWVSVAQVTPLTPSSQILAQDTTVSFARDVFPIIERSCVQCHGGVDENGEQVIEEGLNMTTYEGIMAGSSYGTVLEPGNAEESYMLELLVDGDMPKEGELLSPEEIDAIRRWIAAGAPNN